MLMCNGWHALWQADLQEEAVAAEAAERKRAAGEAELETRLQEVVDSAEGWKAFAEKLGKERGALEAQLTSLTAQLEVHATLARTPD